MPTNTLPTDPSDILAQLLATPSAGPSSSPEQDLYADQPRMDVLTQVAAGQPIPQTEAIRPGGLIGMLAQKFGIKPISQPLPPGVRAQATLVQQALEQQNKARKLAEIQAITPGATMFGSDYGRAVMHQVDPSLESAFPAGMKGKGELEAGATEQRATAAEQKGDIEERKLNLLKTSQNIRDLVAQNKLDQALQLVQVAQGRLQVQREHEQVQKEQGEAAPVNKVYTSRMASIDSQLKSIYPALANVGLNTDPSMKATLESRLQTLLDEQQTLQDNYEQGAKTPSDLFKKKGPAKTSTAPATSSTKSGPALLDPGLFR